MPITETDRNFLKLAIAEGRKSLDTETGGPFGAVIVRDGKILAIARNKVTWDNDPTAHAEVSAIRAACKRVGHFELKGATIYSSCEPCPMCLGAIYWSRISRLVFSNSRNEAAEIAGFDDEFIYQELDKPFSERRLITEIEPLQAGLKLFQDWRDKDDKIEY